MNESDKELFSKINSEPLGQRIVREFYRQCGGGSWIVHEKNDGTFLADVVFYTEDRDIMGSDLIPGITEKTYKDMARKYSNSLRA
jgi:hypothetical protein